MPIFTALATSGKPNIPMEQIAAQRDIAAQRAAMQQYQTQAAAQSAERTADRNLEFQERKFAQESEQRRIASDRAHALSERGLDIQKRGLTQRGLQHAAGLRSAEDIAAERLSRGSEDAESMRNLQVTLAQLGFDKQAMQMKERMTALDNQHTQLIARQDQAYKVSMRRVSLEASGQHKVWVPDEEGGHYETSPEYAESLAIEKQLNNELMTRKAAIARLSDSREIGALLGRDVDPESLRALGFDPEMIRSSWDVMPEETMSGEQRRLMQISAEISDFIVPVSKYAFAYQAANPELNYNTREDHVNWGHFDKGADEFLRGVLVKLPNATPEQVHAAIEIAVSGGPENPLFVAATKSKTPLPGSGNFFGMGKTIVNPSMIMNLFRERLRQKAAKLGILDYERPIGMFNEGDNPFFRNQPKPEKETEFLVDEGIPMVPDFIENIFE